MKKLLVLILISAFVFSGCAYYTCPTYAYAEAPEQDKGQQNFVKEGPVARP
ncbi:MAG: hypothetical protein ACNS60_04315 [Candidatus Cyclobacteriaceae bacterium M2_1C_046]